MQTWNYWKCFSCLYKNFSSHRGYSYTNELRVCEYSRIPFLCKSVLRVHFSQACYMKIIKLMYCTFWTCSVCQETVSVKNRIFSASVCSYNLSVFPSIFKYAVLCSWCQKMSKTMEHQSDENYKQKVCSDNYILTFVWKIVIKNIPRYFLYQDIMQLKDFLQTRYCFTFVIYYGSWHSQQNRALEKLICSNTGFQKSQFVNYRHVCFNALTYITTQQVRGRGI